MVNPISFGSPTHARTHAPTHTRCIVAHRAPPPFGLDWPRLASTGPTAPQLGGVPTNWHTHTHTQYPSLAPCPRTGTHTHAHTHNYCDCHNPSCAGRVFVHPLSLSSWMVSSAAHSHHYHNPPVPVVFVHALSALLLLVLLLLLSSQASLGSRQPSRRVSTALCALPWTRVVISLGWGFSMASLPATRARGPHGGARVGSQTMPT